MRQKIAQIFNEKQKQIDCSSVIKKNAFFYLSILLYFIYQMNIKLYVQKISLCYLSAS